MVLSLFTSGLLVISQNSAGEMKGKQKDVILTVYLRAFKHTVTQHSDNMY